MTVTTEPTGPSQTCAVANGSGNASASVTNVQVACSVGYTIGGTISGLTGTGLVLQDNGGDNLTITGNGSFTFATALTSGSSYDVTVLTQPSSPSETCAVTDGRGPPPTLPIFPFPARRRWRANGLGERIRYGKSYRHVRHVGEILFQQLSRSAAKSCVLDRFIGQPGSLEAPDMVPRAPTDSSMTFGSIAVAIGLG